MLLKTKNLILAFSVGIMPLCFFPAEAEAGPLLDWIRNRCRRNTPAPMVAQNSMGLQPGQCMTTCQQTCSRTVVNYVPYTAYRTEYKRVPVTQYRPVTNTDPCTGCTVTCMKPCTTYTYQTQRVPYTTFRPEYRTESYRVPVTTITNDCATGNCGTPMDNCPTCIPANQQPMLTPGTFNSQPGNGTYYEYPATNPPRGAIMNDGSSFSNNAVPADAQPTLAPQSSSRPIFERINSAQQSRQPIPTNYPQATPAYYPPGQTAETPVRRQWDYSPARLASYRSEPSRVEAPAEQRRFSATLSSKPQAPRFTDLADDLNGWTVVK